MKKIVLCTNVQRDGDFSCTAAVKDMLEAEGCQVVVSPVCGEPETRPPFPTEELDRAWRGRTFW